MNICLRCLLILVGLVLLAACSEEPKKEYREPDWDRLTRADNEAPAPVPKSESEVVAPAVSMPADGHTNTPPRIVEVTTTVEKSVRQGAVTVRPVAEDADGDPVEFRYQWLINGEEDPFLQEATLPADSYAKGDQIQVRVIPFDGQEEGKPYLSRPLETPNAAPLITSQPPLSFQAQVYSYQVTATDPDDTELTILLDDPPAGMTISDTGLISWPLAKVEPGDYRITIVVTDQEGASAIQEFTLSLDKTVVKAED